MLNRRDFIKVAGTAALLPTLSRAAPGPQRLVLYANVGNRIDRYDVDASAATLRQRGSAIVPSDVQYAWPHYSNRVLYVVTSDGKAEGGRHFLLALRIDPDSGALTPHGEPVALPIRPINVTADMRSQHVLVAFNIPSSLRVYRINGDLTVGAEVRQPAVTDCGFYAHQIRVTRDNHHAVLVTRGNSRTRSKAEDPGALKWFDYDPLSGVLAHETNIAPEGGYGFGPRHLDFHPTRPWVYVSLERESKLYMFRIRNGRLDAEPSFVRDTVANPGNMLPRQLAGAIHIHPNGRHVYVANRSDDTVDFNGTRVRQGGENSVAVFDIDTVTGEPTLVQSADTTKVYPRTFFMDPEARIMVAEHNLPIEVRDGDGVKTVQAGLTVFRMESNGRLALQRVYDVDVGNSSMYWMDILKIA